MRIKHIMTVAGLALTLSQSVSAVDLGSTYTGATPLNTLSYNFDGGSRILTLMMTGPDANEFVTAWGFDIVGNTAGAALDSASGVGPFVLFVPSPPSLNPMSFDFGFAFQTAAGVARFQAGDSVDIYLPNVSSVLNSGAHVQGISGERSGKVTVPEPASLLSGLAALGMLAVGRKRIA